MARRIHDIASAVAADEGAACCCAYVFNIPREVDAGAERYSRGARKCCSWRIEAACRNKVDARAVEILIVGVGRRPARPPAALREQGGVLHRTNLARAPPATAYIAELYAKLEVTHAVAIPRGRCYLHYEAPLVGVPSVDVGRPPCPAIGVAGSVRRYPRAPCHRAAAVAAFEEVKKTARGAYILRLDADAHIGVQWYGASEIDAHAVGVKVVAVARPRRPVIYIADRHRAVLIAMRAIRRILAVVGELQADNRRRAHNRRLNRMLAQQKPRQRA